MKPKKINDILKPLYYKMDNDYKSYSSVCEKGCFFCCYQPIELITIEKFTLGEFIKNNLSVEIIDKIKVNLIKWLDFFDNNTSKQEPLTSKEVFEDFRFKAEKIPFPCPLLINAECSVYKVRPFVCRSHFVNDSKEFCRADKLRNGSGESLRYRDQMLEYLKSMTTLEIIPLSYALVDILKIKRTVKKIAKSTLK